MTVCSYIFTKYTGTCLKENIFSKIFFQVDSIALDPDPDPNWAKILDPDPYSMYLDSQHWLEVTTYLYK